MADISTLIVKVSPVGWREAEQEIKKTEQTAKNAGQSFAQLASNAHASADAITGAGRAAKAVTKDFTDMFRELLNAREGVAGLVGGFLRIGTGTYLVQRALQSTIGLITNLVGPAVNAAASLEKMAASYRVLAETPYGGMELLEFSKGLARELPITVEAMDKANRTLLGFGFTVADIMEVLPRLADVTQGNSEQFAHLALVYGQVRAQGKAMQQDMYQFVNAGIPIMEALADVIGKPTTAIREMVKEGEIGLAEFEEAIKRLSTESGRFADFNKETADVFQNQLVVASNNWKQILAEIGNVILPTLSASLQISIDQMQKLLNSSETAKKALEFISIERFVSAGDIKGMEEWFGGLSGVTSTQIQGYIDYARSANPLPTAKQAAALRRAEQLAVDYAMRPPAAKSTAQSGVGSSGGGPAKEEIYKSINDKLWRNFVTPYDEYFMPGGTGLGIVPGGLQVGTGAGAPPDIWELMGLGTQTGLMRMTVPEAVAGGTGGPMGPMFAQLQEMEKIWDDMWKSVGTGVMDTSISTFVEVMQDLGAGTLDAEAAFKKYMATITAQMAPLFIRAGLEMISKGTPEAIGVGLVLLGLGGISALASGWAGASESSGVRYDYGALATTVNPYGTNVGSFANGGVFNSPSLSSYSNGVYNSPRFFAFANGGVFGEAGPEAIMPLARGANGKLGVMASGGVSVLVQNIDQSGRGVSVTQEESTGPGGEKIIRNIIRDVVNETIASGKADSALRSRNLAASGARARS